MIAENHIRESLARYLRGEISLDQLEDWLVERSWNMHRDSDEAVQKLVGAVELRLAEYSNGHLDDADLKHELEMILVHGSGPALENMVIFTIGRKEYATTASSTFTEPPPISRVVIPNCVVTPSETRSAAGRTIAGQELLQKPA